MTITIDPVNTSVDTFGVLVQRLNEVVDALDSRVVTAGIGSPDVTEGNVNLVGDLSATNMSASGTMRTSLIDRPVGSVSPYITLLSPLAARASARSTIQNFHASGPRNTFQNNNITWDVGLSGSEANGVNSDFTIEVQGSPTALRLTRGGDLSLGGSASVSSVVTPVVTSPSNITIAASNGTIKLSSQTEVLSSLKASDGFQVTGGTMLSSVPTTFNASVNATSTMTVAGLTYLNALNVNSAATFASNTRFQGKATFDLPIAGSIEGNAATASAVQWTGINGKPTTVAGYAISDAITSSSAQPFNIFAKNAAPSLTLHNSDGWIGRIHVGGNHMRFVRSLGANNTIDNNNWVFIIDLSNQNATFAANLYINGEMQSRSDRRSKSDIRPIKNGLEIVKNLHGRRYIKDEVESIGVIAQELEEQLPELVSADADGYKYVAYGNIVAVLIEAVKELSAKVDANAKNF